jgi:hypothetical protein
MALGNAVARQEVIKDPAWVARVGLADSTLSFWYNDAWRHHYVAGPLVDAITGVLLAVGLSIALFRLRKRAERLMFTWFVGGLLLIGFTNYYNPGAHLTRLQLVMPAVALLAGLAAAKLHWALRFGLRINTPVIQTVVVTLLVVAAMLNLRQLLVDGPAILPRYSENMVMKTLQENPGYQVVEVGTSGTDEDATVIMLKPYPWLQDRFRYAPVSNFSGPFIETFGNTPTIFVTFNHDVADVLTPVLYPKYPVTREVFPPGESYMWLYKPVSPTKSHPPGN